VLGVAVTAALTWPRRPVLFLFFLPLRLRTAAIGLGLLWFACTLLPSPWFRLGPGSSIGAVVTALMISALEPRLNRAFDRAALRRDRDRFLEEVDVRRRTDGILDKITREGMASLSRSERKILKQASQILNRGKARPHE
jgi:hypothetical protein